MSTTNTLDLPKASKNGTVKAKRIAIQGYPGAFHEMAARHYFEGTPVEIIPADTFQEVVALVEDPEMADVGLMAIENTLAGGMLPNHKLINNSSLHITGEIYLRIVQNLMVLPGQKIEDLTEVHSHYMAIRQCRKFFRQYPNIRLVESLDTALSAKKIRDGNLKGRGAIASNLAAEMYDLDILGPSIETNKQNYTRFLVLQHPYFSGNDANKVDKASISFTTSHEAGSLNKVLSVLAAYNINLSKIQSVPIEGRHWEYMFFVDLTAESSLRLDQALNAVRPICHNLKVLGLYERGRHV